MQRSCRPAEMHGRQRICPADPRRDVQLRIHQPQYTPRRSRLRATTRFLLRQRYRRMPDDDRVSAIVETARCAPTRFGSITVETPDADATKPCRDFAAASLRRSEGWQRRTIFFAPSAFTSQPGSVVRCPERSPVEHQHRRQSLALAGGIRACACQGCTQPKYAEARRGLHDASRRGRAGAALAPSQRARSTSAPRPAEVDLAAGLARPARHRDRQRADGVLRHAHRNGHPCACRWLQVAPLAPVEWMVCDMVEQPSRIARWWPTGCFRALPTCDLQPKLPAKKRHEDRSMPRTDRQTIAQANLSYRLRLAAP